MRKQHDGSQTTIYFQLASYLKRHWVDFLLGILGTAAASGIAAAFTWFLKPLLNKGFITPDPVFIRWAPLIIILAYLASGLTCFMGDFFIARSARKVVRDLQRSIFNKFLVLPLSFLNKQSSGNLLSTLVYNVDQIADTVANALLTIIKDGLYLVGLIVVMWLNSWLLTLIFLISAPMVGVIIKITAVRLKRLSLAVQGSVGAMAHIAKETLEGEQIVRSFAGEQYEKDKMEKTTQQLCSRQVKITITSSMGVALARIIPAMVVAFIVYLATSPHHVLSVGAFVSTVAAMFAAFKPFKNLMDVNSVLQRGMAGAQSVFAILDAEVEKDHGRILLQSIRGEIEFQQVSFTYPGRDKPVLSDFSFKILPGQKAALVGPSGSGKTTIINLLSRFYEVDRGTILLDGQDIRKIQLASLRSQLAMVSDRISLFNDTVFRNMAYGCLDRIEEKSIYEAAEKACLMPWINELPEKMNTIVGDNGVLLSAGQRQRMAIARAILKNAPILILDEATSVIDLDTERLIQSTISQLGQNKTVIIISHRLSADSPVDRVITL